MKRYKPILAAIVLVATITLAALYMQSHPEVITSLQKTSLGTIVTLLGLYSISLLGLLAVLKGSLKIVGSTIGHKQGLLLTIYSTLINFFGPLQSGPGFRALYLKKYHGVSLKGYGGASLVYYALYAVISLILLLIGSDFWWLALPSICIILALLYGAARYQTRFSFKLPIIEAGVLTLFGTMLQLGAICAIYYVELRVLDAGISLRQALSYAGAANFALFVSLTPGAIGFRESFLLLSQRIHNIDSQTIIAANVIDRSVYVLFLGFLGLLALYLKANQRLHVRQLHREHRPAKD